MTATHENQTTRPEWTDLAAWTDVQFVEYAAKLQSFHPNDFKSRPAVFEEIDRDVGFLIQNVIRPYIDPSCVNLTEEELTSECRVKLATLFHNRKNISIPNRHEFFRYLKTALNNHVKGQVQRHRFTVKRTGIRPPSKGDVWAEHRKPIETSLDDPDSHIQVPEASFGDIGHELLEDLCSVLTPLEELVVQQIIRPNATTILHVMLDIWSESTHSNKVSYEHLALGLGMPVDLFLSIRKQAQAKLKKLMKENTDNFAWNASTAFLSQVFAVEVPRSTEKSVVKRLFSLAARNMVNRVNDEVKRHMQVIGARVPADQGATLSCYGIMYEDANHKCMGCGVKSACVVETRSLGLCEITPHPSILGARSSRVPAVNIDTATAAVRRSMPQVPDDDMGVNYVKIVDYLNTHFKRAEQALKDAPHEKITSFALNTAGGEGVSKSPIFWMSKNSSDGNVSIRFTKPSEALKAKLQQVANGYYLPKDITAEEAIKLIDELVHEKQK
jgi:hypothetical protein